MLVDGDWSDWSQWSPCTKNINGIQMRSRRCENPKPQFGRRPCRGSKATAIRGCTDISTCSQGIWQMLKNIFFFYYPTPQDFPSTIHSLLIWNFFCRIVFISLYIRRRWGVNWSFDATLEKLEGQEKNIIKFFRAILAMKMHQLFFPSKSQNRRIYRTPLRLHLIHLWHPHF